MVRENGADFFGVQSSPFNGFLPSTKRVRRQVKALEWESRAFTVVRVDGGNAGWTLAVAGFYYYYYSKHVYYRNLSFPLYLLNLSLIPSLFVCGRGD